MQILPPIEINTNQFVQISVDILEPQVQQHVIKLIRAKRIARKADGGPPPLRNRMHLWGLPGLAPRDQAKLQLGHEFMHLTVQWVRLLHASGLGWSVENPASSFLWEMPPMWSSWRLCPRPRCSGSTCAGLAPPTRSRQRCSPTSTYGNWLCFAIKLSGHILMSHWSAQCSTRARRSSRRV